jgi:hypothetical protein
MKKLHKFKAYVLPSNSTAVINAIIDDDTDLLTKLMLNPKQCEQIDKYWGHMTPLHLCIAHNNFKALAILLANGAKPSPRLEYFPYSTPLHRAVQYKDDAAITLLVLYGADTDKLADSHVHSAKMLAQGDTHLVKVIEQASKWRALINCYEEKIKYAESQQDTKKATEYYGKLAEIWQKIAQQEINLDIKNFYEQKALDYYKKAQPTSVNSMLSAQDSSRSKYSSVHTSSPTMIFSSCCPQLFKVATQSEERKPLLEQSTASYTYSLS